MGYAWHCRPTEAHEQEPMPFIYVETLIRASLDDLWRFTQQPELHQRWDLRFTSITYLPRADETQPQRFLYETRVGFGVRIRGEGESVGTREDVGGMRTSALKFWSDDPRSLIRVGSGYWQYVPTAEGIRFLTRYDYETRFGLPGRVFDRLVFRPLLGWATAWSFDRLRLWLEEGIDPGVSFERSLVHAVARLSLAAIWLYQGLVPKFLAPESGELDLLRAAQVFGGWEPLALRLIGGGEVFFGLLLVALWRSRALYGLSCAALLVLLVGAAASTPALLVAPFNPLTLTLAMIGLAAIGWLASARLPTARACLRQPRRAREARA
ncbi:MAG: DoxX-like family protein [Chloroflexi bacterium]|nr:DoxX-like family protein [Chloroflexota bacterium]